MLKNYGGITQEEFDEMREKFFGKKNKPQHTMGNDLVWVTEPVSAPTSATAKERVTTELKELTEKMVKLNTYTNTDHYAGLSEEHQTLLSLQYKAMDAYAQILGRRLNIWED